MFFIFFIYISSSKPGIGIKVLPLLPIVYFRQDVLSVKHLQNGFYFFLADSEQTGCAISQMLQNLRIFNEKLNDIQQLHFDDLLILIEIF